MAQDGGAWGWGHTGPQQEWQGLGEATGMDAGDGGDAGGGGSHRAGGRGVGGVQGWQRHVGPEVGGTQGARGGAVAPWALGGGTLFPPTHHS